MDDIKYFVLILDEKLGKELIQVKQELAGLVQAARFFTGVQSPHWFKPIACLLIDGPCLN